MVSGAGPCNTLDCQHGQCPRHEEYQCRACSYVKGLGLCEGWRPLLPNVCALLCVLVGQVARLHVGHVRPVHLDVVLQASRSAGAEQLQLCSQFGHIPVRSSQALCHLQMTPAYSCSQCAGWHGPGICYACTHTVSWGSPPWHRSLHRARWASRPLPWRA